MQTILDEVAKTLSLRNRTQAPFEKSAAYFEFERHDVQSLVPSSARKLLDIGCGAGRLGAALKLRQNCRVTGVELITSAAERARERLDRVVEYAVEKLPENAFEEMEFDCIILADVLEHLRNPRDVLAKCRHWLAWKKRGQEPI